MSLFPSEVGSATLQNVRGGVLRPQFVGNKVHEEFARLQPSDAAINASLEGLRCSAAFLHGARGIDRAGVDTGARRAGPDSGLVRRWP